MYSFARYLIVEQDEAPRLGPYGLRRGLIDGRTGQEYWTGKTIDRQVVRFMNWLRGLRFPGLLRYYAATEVSFGVGLNRGIIEFSLPEQQQPARVRVLDSRSTAILVSAMFARLFSFNLLARCIECSIEAQLRGSQLGSNAVSSDAGSLQSMDRTQNQTYPLVRLTAPSAAPYCGALLVRPCHRPCLAHPFARKHSTASLLGTLVVA